MKTGIIPCVGLVLSLCGCVAIPLAAAGGFSRVVGVSNAKGNMARATALALGGHVNPDSIKISESHIGMHEARWVADTPGGRYACTDDDDVTGPAYCAAKR